MTLCIVSKITSFQFSAAEAITFPSGVYNHIYFQEKEKVNEKNHHCIIKSIQGMKPMSILHTQYIDIDHITIVIEDLKSSIITLCL